MAIYEDRPSYNILLRLVILVVPTALLIGSLYSWQSGNSGDALALLIEAAVVGLLFYLIFPRRYQVYPEYLRIALGGPLAVKVRFSQLKEVKINSGLFVGISMATGMGREHVEIIKVKGPKIGITPADPTAFVEQANRAFEEWRSGPAPKPAF